MNNIICFICLDKCNNKVCNTCNCCAHHKCWGKYLKHKTTNYLIITDENISISTPLSVECPQCRQNINRLKPVTRADTYIARYIVFIESLNNFLFSIHFTENKKDQKQLFKNAFNVINQNKNLFIRDYTLKKYIKKEMRKLNNNYNLNMKVYTIF
jgi:hypothetical protein